MSNHSEWYNLNWHDDQPFLDFIQKTVPSSNFKQAIQDRLLEIWVAEHYDFKIYKDKDLSTLYDNDLSNWNYRKDIVTQEIKKEEEAFKKLFEKFQAQEHIEVSTQPPQVASTGESTEEEEETANDTVVKSKDIVVHKVCKESRRTIAKNMKHEIMLAKSIKSSMATTQQTLVDLQKELDELNEKISTFESYQKAAQYSIREMKKIALAYEKTKDREALVKALDSLLSYRDAMMRRNISPNPCSGQSGICKTHHLHLSPARYDSKGLIKDAKCCMSP